MDKRSIIKRLGSKVLNAYNKFRPVWKDDVDIASEINDPRGKNHVKTELRFMENSKLVGSKVISSRLNETHDHNIADFLPSEFGIYGDEPQFKIGGVINVPVYYKMYDVTIKYSYAGDIIKEVYKKIPFGTIITKGIFINDVPSPYAILPEYTFKEITVWFDKPHRFDVIVPLGHIDLGDVINPDAPTHITRVKYMYKGNVIKDIEVISKGKLPITNKVLHEVPDGYAIKGDIGTIQAGGVKEFDLKKKKITVTISGIFKGSEIIRETLVVDNGYLLNVSTKVRPPQFHFFVESEIATWDNTIATDDIDGEVITINVYYKIAWTPIDVDAVIKRFYISYKYGDDLVGKQEFRRSKKDGLFPQSVSDLTLPADFKVHPDIENNLPTTYNSDIDISVVYDDYSAKLIYKNDRLKANDTREVTFVFHDINTGNQVYTTKILVDSDTKFKFSQGNMIFNETIGIPLWNGTDEYPFSTHVGEYADTFEDLTTAVQRLQTLTTTAGIRGIFNISGIKRGSETEAEVTDNHYIFGKTIRDKDVLLYPTISYEPEVDNDSDTIRLFVVRYYDGDNELANFRTTIAHRGPGVPVFNTFDTSVYEINTGKPMMFDGGIYHVYIKVKTITDRFKVVIKNPNNYQDHDMVNFNFGEITIDRLVTEPIDYTSAIAKFQAIAGDNAFYFDWVNVVKKTEGEYKVLGINIIEDMNRTYTYTYLVRNKLNTQRRIISLFPVNPFEDAARSTKYEVLNDDTNIATMPVRYFAQDVHTAASTIDPQTNRFDLISLMGSLWNDYVGTNGYMQSYSSFKGNNWYKIFLPYDIKTGTSRYASPKLGEVKLKVEILSGRTGNNVIFTKDANYTPTDIDSAFRHSNLKYTVDFNTNVEYYRIKITSNKHYFPIFSSIQEYGYFTQFSENWSTPDEMDHVEEFLEGAIPPTHFIYPLGAFLEHNIVKDKDRYFDMDPYSQNIKHDYFLDYITYKNNEFVTQKHWWEGRVINTVPYIGRVKKICDGWYENLVPYVGDKVTVCFNYAFYNYISLEFNIRCLPSWMFNDLKPKLAPYFAKATNKNKIDLQMNGMFMFTGHKLFETNMDRLREYFYRSIMTPSDIQEKDRRYDSNIFVNNFQSEHIDNLYIRNMFMYSMAMFDAPLFIASNIYADKVLYFAKYMGGKFRVSTSFKSAKSIADFSGLSFVYEDSNIPDIVGLDLPSYISIYGAASDDSRTRTKAINKLDMDIDVRRDLQNYITTQSSIRSEGTLAKYILGVQSINYSNLKFTGALNIGGITRQPMRHVLTTLSDNHLTYRGGGYSYLDININDDGENELSNKVYIGGTGYIKNARYTSPRKMASNGHDVYVYRNVSKSQDTEDGKRYSNIAKAYWSNLVSGKYNDSLVCTMGYYYESLRDEISSGQEADVLSFLPYKKDFKGHIYVSSSMVGAYFNGGSYEYPVSPWGNIHSMVSTSNMSEYEVAKKIRPYNRIWKFDIYMDFINTCTGKNWEDIIYKNLTMETYKYTLNNRCYDPNIVSKETIKYLDDRPMYFGSAFANKNAIKRLMNLFVLQEILDVVSVDAEKKSRYIDTFVSIIGNRMSLPAENDSSILRVSYNRSNDHIEYVINGNRKYMKNLFSVEKELYDPFNNLSDVNTIKTYDSLPFATDMYSKGKLLLFNPLIRKGFELSINRKIYNKAYKDFVSDRYHVDLEESDHILDQANIPYVPYLIVFSQPNFSGTLTLEGEIIAVVVDEFNNFLNINSFDIPPTAKSWFFDGTVKTVKVGGDAEHDANRISILGYTIAMLVWSYGIPKITTSNGGNVIEAFIGTPSFNKSLFEELHEKIDDPNRLRGAFIQSLAIGSGREGIYDKASINTRSQHNFFKLVHALLTKQNENTMLTAFNVRSDNDKNIDDTIYLPYNPVAGTTTMYDGIDSTVTDNWVNNSKRFKAHLYYSLCRKYGEVSLNERGVNANTIKIVGICGPIPFDDSVTNAIENDGKKYFDFTDMFVRSDLEYISEDAFMYVTNKRDNILIGRDMFRYKQDETGRFRRINLLGQNIINAFGYYHHLKDNNFDPTNTYRIDYAKSVDFYSEFGDSPMNYIPVGLIDATYHKYYSSTFTSRSKVFIAPVIGASSIFNAYYNKDLDSGGVSNPITTYPIGVRTMSINGTNYTNQYYPSTQVFPGDGVYTSGRQSRVSSKFYNPWAMLAEAYRISYSNTSIIPDELRLNLHSVSRLICVFVESDDGSYTLFKKTIIDTVAVGRWSYDIDRMFGNIITGSQYKDTHVFKEMKVIDKEHVLDRNSVDDPNSYGEIITYNSIAEKEDYAYTNRIHTTIGVFYKQKPQEREFTRKISLRTCMEKFPGATYSFDWSIMPVLVDNFSGELEPIIGYNADIKVILPETDMGSLNSVRDAFINGIFKLDINNNDFPLRNLVVDTDTAKYEDLFGFRKGSKLIKSNLGINTCEYFMTNDVLKKVMITGEKRIDAEVKFNLNAKAFPGSTIVSEDNEDISGFGTIVKGGILGEGKSLCLAFVPTFMVLETLEEASYTEDIVAQINITPTSKFKLDGMSTGNNAAFDITNEMRETARSKYTSHATRILETVNPLIGNKLNINAIKPELTHIVNLITSETYTRSSSFMDTIKGLYTYNEGSDLDTSLFNIDAFTDLSIRPASAQTHGEVKHYKNKFTYTEAGEQNNASFDVDETFMFVNYHNKTFRPGTSGKLNGIPDLNSVQQRQIRILSKLLKLMTKSDRIFLMPMTNNITKPIFSIPKGDLVAFTPRQLTSSSAIYDEFGALDLYRFDQGNDDVPYEFAEFFISYLLGSYYYKGFTRVDLDVNETFAYTKSKHIKKFYWSEIEPDITKFGQHHTYIGADPTNIVSGIYANIYGSSGKVNYNIGFNVWHSDTLTRVRDYMNTKVNASTTQTVRHLGELVDGTFYDTKDRYWRSLRESIADFTKFRFDVSENGMAAFVTLPFVDSESDMGNMFALTELGVFEPAVNKNNNLYLGLKSSDGYLHMVRKLIDKINAGTGNIDTTYRLKQLTMVPEAPIKRPNVAISNDPNKLYPWINEGQIYRYSDNIAFMTVVDAIIDSSQYEIANRSTYRSLVSPNGSHIGYSTGNSIHPNLKYWTHLARRSAYDIGVYTNNNHNIESTVVRWTDEPLSRALADHEYMIYSHYGLTSGANNMASINGQFTVPPYIICGYTRRAPYTHNSNASNPSQEDIKMTSMAGIILNAVLSSDVTYGKFIDIYPNEQLSADGDTTPRIAVYKDLIDVNKEVKEVFANSNIQNVSSVYDVAKYVTLAWERSNNFMRSYHDAVFMTYPYYNESDIYRLAAGDRAINDANGQTIIYYTKENFAYKFSKILNIFDSYSNLFKTKIDTSKIENIRLIKGFMSYTNHRQTVDYITEPGRWNINSMYSIIMRQMENEKMHVRNSDKVVAALDIYRSAPDNPYGTKGYIYGFGHLLAQNDFAYTGRYNIDAQNIAKYPVFMHTSIAEIVNAEVYRTDIELVNSTLRVLLGNKEKINIETNFPLSILFTVAASCISLVMRNMIKLQSGEETPLIYGWVGASSNLDGHFGAMQRMDIVSRYKSSDYKTGTKAYLETGIIERLVYAKINTPDTYNQYSPSGDLNTANIPEYRVGSNTGVQWGVFPELIIPILVKMIMSVLYVKHQTLSLTNMKYFATLFKVKYRVKDQSIIDGNAIDASLQNFMDRIVSNITSKHNFYPDNMVPDTTWLTHFTYGEFMSKFSTAVDRVGTMSSHTLDLTEANILKYFKINDYEIMIPFTFVRMWFYVPNIGYFPFFYGYIPMSKNAFGQAGTVQNQNIKDMILTFIKSNMSEYNYHTRTSTDKNIMVITYTDYICKLRLNTVTKFELIFRPDGAVNIAIELPKTAVISHRKRANASDVNTDYANVNIVANHAFGQILTTPSGFNSANHTTITSNLNSYSKYIPRNVPNNYHTYLGKYNMLGSFNGICTTYVGYQRVEESDINDWTKNLNVIFTVANMRSKFEMDANGVTFGERDGLNDKTTIPLLAEVATGSPEQAFPKTDFKNFFIRALKKKTRVQFIPFKVHNMLTVKP